jgi:lipopolysaccharide export system protein LptA
MKMHVGAIAIAALLAGVSAAYAQIDRSEGPVQITSNSFEYFQKEARGVYVGNVQAIQGNSRLTADKLTAICQRTAQGECEEIRVLIAEGNVIYTAPDVAIRGDRGEYDYPSDTITLTGDVISKRGDEGVMQGTRMVYSVGEGRVTLTAQGDRVTSIFNTAKKQEGARPAPAPAPRPN